MRIEQIETNKAYIDYTTLNLIRKVLGKDLKELGKEHLLGAYYTKLGFYTKTWSSVALRYLIAVLEYLNPSFSYNRELPIGKPIVADENAFQEIMNGNIQLLDQLESKTPSAFKKYGILTGAQEHMVP